MRPTTKHAVPPAGDICRLSAVELADRIRRRQLSVREVIAAFLNRIGAVNPLVNAIVSLRERADILREADEADAHLAHDGHAGSLFGLPIAIKDLALTRGIATTFGSPIFAGFIPAEDDFFVERLRQAGAIIIGKTNVPEFGLGSNTYNTVFGQTLNAFDPALTAGGSSGGAAVALALDMVPIADGSDLGGSLRNPAAYNNVYGFRPSQGLVPNGPSLDVFHAQMGVKGPMGRSVRDMALLLDVQAGYHPRSPLSHNDKPGSFLQAMELPSAGGHVAWLGDLDGHLPVEPGILELCETALGRLAGVSFLIEPLVSDFDFEALWQAFVILRQANNGCALRIHYDDPNKRNLLKPETVWEVESALRLTAAQVHAASVVRSSWYLTLLSLFDRFDLVALPSAQVFPFAVDIPWPREVAGRTMDSYHRWMQVSVLATMAGCPAVNVPAGFDAKGRPMGMQLIGPPRDDLSVLRAAAAYEATLPWQAGAC
ncbi:amidase [Mesorhizobium sp. M0622]|uniref:amidase n=1 Tax=Mesorhizobium sp. M0622 TaxID=2956975 RepID=UPI00333535C4